MSNGFSGKVDCRCLQISLDGALKMGIAYNLWKLQDLIWLFILSQLLNILSFSQMSQMWSIICYLMLTSRRLKWLVSSNLIFLILELFDNYDAWSNLSIFFMKLHCKHILTIWQLWCSAGVEIWPGSVSQCVTGVMTLILIWLWQWLWFWLLWQLWCSAGVEIWPAGSVPQYVTGVNVKV